MGRYLLFRDIQGYAESLLQSCSTPVDRDNLGPLRTIAQRSAAESDAALVAHFNGLTYGLNRAWKKIKTVL